jgi:hypothetical protein
MAQMSMNRVIHSALRRDLGRFDVALVAFVEGDSRRAEQLWTAWENFDEQLTTHHLGEHNIVWPTLRQLGLKEDLITQWDHEHDELAEALRTAGDAMRELRRSPSATNAKSARDAMAKLSEVARGRPRAVLPRPEGHSRDQGHESEVPDEAASRGHILRLVAGWGECRRRGRFEGECSAPGCGGADHPVRAVVSSNDRAGVGGICVRIHEPVVEF